MVSGLVRREVTIVLYCDIDTASFEGFLIYLRGREGAEKVPANDDSVQP